MESFKQLFKLKWNKVTIINKPANTLNILERENDFSQSIITIELDKNSIDLDFYLIIKVAFDEDKFKLPTVAFT